MPCQLCPSNVTTKNNITVINQLINRPTLAASSGKRKQRKASVSCPSVRLSVSSSIYSDYSRQRLTREQHRRAASVCIGTSDVLGHLVSKIDTFSGVLGGIRGYTAFF